METMRKMQAHSQHRLFSSPWLLWLVWIVWLPFLTPDIVQLLQGPVAPVSVAALAGQAVFVAVYAFCAFRVALSLSARSGPEASARVMSLRRTGVTLFLLAASVAIALMGKPKDMYPTSLFIFTAAYAGTAFRIPRAIITNAVVLAACLATGVFLGSSFSALLPAVFVIPVVSFMTMSWTRSIIVGRQLHEAQGQIARLAAADERLRIARDLHDLLGQKLSFIALKSELARHLIPSAPDKAAAEIAEVESTVRSTLQEVREAVAGYRKPDLAHELRAAAEILSAAGIQLVRTGDPDAAGRLSPGRNEALAWAVREGVTNVIRHSRAKTCTIDLREDGRSAVVEISDDGNGGAGAAPGVSRGGSGLRGLHERFEALGGECDARGRAQGGFVLTATVPAEGQE
ncbi:MAG: sensor histidine kinase [Spirochaetia bacterium]